MARRRLSIQVELIEGAGGHCWPRRGRILATAPTHTFARAMAIDVALDQWGTRSPFPAR